MVVLVHDVAGEPSSVSGEGVWIAYGMSMRVGNPDVAAFGHVGSSSEFHQWIYLIFPYTMVYSKTCFENFDFWV